MSGTRWNQTFDSRESRMNLTNGAAVAAPLSFGDFSTYCVLGSSSGLMYSMGFSTGPVPIS